VRELTRERGETKGRNNNCKKSQRQQITDSDVAQQRSREKIRLYHVLPRGRSRTDRSIRRKGSNVCVDLTYLFRTPLEEKLERQNQGLHGASAFPNSNDLCGLPGGRPKLDDALGRSRATNSTCGQILRKISGNPRPNDLGLTGGPIREVRSPNDSGGGRTK